MKLSFYLSNFFFIFFVITLVIAIIFFEIGLRAFRNENERKSKENNKLGFRWLLVASILLLFSILFSLLKF